MLKSYSEQIIITAPFNGATGAGGSASKVLTADIPNKKLPVIKEINYKVIMGTGNAAPLAAQTFAFDCVFGAYVQEGTITDAYAMGKDDSILPGMSYSDAFQCNGTSGIGHLFPQRRVYATVELPLPTDRLYYAYYCLGVIAGADVIIDVVYELKKYTSDQFLQIATMLYKG